MGHLIDHAKIFHLYTVQCSFTGLQDFTNEIYINGLMNELKSSNHEIIQLYYYPESLLLANFNLNSARVERLELPANGFGDRYSTN